MKATHQVVAFVASVARTTCSIYADSEAITADPLQVTCRRCKR